MSSFEEIERLFHACLDLPEGERAEWLREKAAGDEGLIEEVERLLVATGKEDLLERSAVARPFSQQEERGPDRIGAYEIEAQIGEGATSTVFRARDTRNGRLVAVKAMHRGPRMEEVGRRFLAETQLLGRLSHPGLCSFFEASEAEASRGKTSLGQVFYFAMELVEGVRIDDFVRINGLTTTNVLALLLKITQTVAYLHQNGVIHRDLKPANILVCKPTGGEVAIPKILDLGIARILDQDSRETVMTQTGQILGTLAYMSPEQARGLPQIDTRSDVYALGVIAYELLSGQKLEDLGTSSVHEAMRRIIERHPTAIDKLRPELAGDVATIIHKALEKEPDHRYSSAADFAEDLARHLRGEAIRARPASTWRQLKDLTRRHRFLVAGAGATALALILGTITSTWFALNAKEEAIATKRALYRAQIARAYSALFRGEAELARLAFQEVQVSEEDRGAFEYRFLHSQIDRTRSVEEHKFAGNLTHSYPFKTPIGRIACFDASGQAWHLQSKGDGVQLHREGETAAIMAWRLGSPPLTACLSNSATRVACQTGDLKLFILARDRKLPLFVRSLPAKPKQLCFSRDDSTLAVVLAREVLVLSADTGNEFCRIPRPKQEKSDVLFRIDLTRDGSRLIAVFQRQILIYDARSGKQLRSQYVAEANFAAYSPDDSMVAVGTDRTRRRVLVLDASSLKTLTHFEGHRHGIEVLAWSRDGKRCLSGSIGALRIWSTESGKQLGVVPWDSEPCTFSWDERGQRVLISSASRTRILDIDPAPCRTLLGHATYVYRVVHSHDGRLLASRDFGLSVRLWNRRTGAQIWARPISNLGSALEFSEDDRRVRTNGEQKLIDFDTQTGERVAEQADDVSVGPGAKRVMEFAGERKVRSVDGRYVASYEVGTLSVHDLTGKQMLWSRKLGNVSALAINSVATTLAIGHADGTMSLAELRTGKPLASAKGHGSDIYSIVFSKDGKRLITGSNDRMLMIWRVHPLEVLATLEGHKSYVHSVSLSPDGLQIASGSGDHSIKLWEIRPVAH